jgi:hypothetical protein
MAGYEFELSREQLIGCWKVLAPSGVYIELRDDGTARQKESWKGVTGDLTGKILWRFIKPSSLELVYYLEGQTTPLAVHEYKAKYFKGKRLEWWHVRLNDSVIQDLNVMPAECWTRTRPPKSWQPKE